jgi:hypothetical protein
MPYNKSDLLSRWEGVLSAGTGLFNLVDADHPLRIFIGGNSGGDATLSLVLEDRPPHIPSFSSLTIEQRLRPDGTWLFLIQLGARDAFPEFVAMCQELINRGVNGTDEGTALRSFVRGLDEWRKLFKPVKDDVLSEQALRGLVAELAVMLDLARMGRPWSELISGWVGPLGAPQDFHLSNGLFIEAKSVHLDSTLITISSAEQLAIAEESQLMLSTVLVERSPSTDLTRTPLDLCSSVHDALVGHFDLSDDFSLRLKEMGFDEANLDYADAAFLLGSPRYFAVDVDFPKLTPPQLPKGVFSVEYRLSLSELQRYTLEPDNVKARLEGTAPWN